MAAQVGGLICYMSDDEDDDEDEDDDHHHHQLLLQQQQQQEQISLVLLSPLTLSFSVRLRVWPSFYIPALDFWWLQSQEVTVAMEVVL